MITMKTIGDTFIPGVLDDLPLSAQTMRVLIHILRWLLPPGRGDYQTSISAVADKCRINWRTAKEALRELEKGGFIEVKDAGSHRILVAMSLYFERETRLKCRDELVSNAESTLQKCRDELVSNAESTLQKCRVHYKGTRTGPQKGPLLPRDEHEVSWLEQFREKITRAGQVDETETAVSVDQAWRWFSRARSLDDTLSLEDFRAAYEWFHVNRAADGQWRDFRGEVARHPQSAFTSQLAYEQGRRQKKNGGGSVASVGSVNWAAGDNDNEVPVEVRRALLGCGV